MMDKPKVPKDLKLKIGTEKEAFWTSVKDNLKNQIKSGKNELMLNKELLIVAERKIKEEQRGK